MLTVSSVKKSAEWSRRRVLKSASAALTPAIFPSALKAFPASATVAPFSRFVDVAHAAGLREATIYGEASSFTSIVESMAAGCAFFDYDNDGWMDIFILGGRRLKDAPSNGGNRLYKNNRDGTFTDVTVKAGLAHIGWAQGVCVGDYNNDGFEDLFLTYYGQNQLYKNNGDGTFTDITAKAGLLHATDRYNTGCTFLDYNRDGFLDLFVANYLEVDEASAPRPDLGTPACKFETVPVFCGPRGLPKAQNYLYRNNGDGTFTDVSKESGISSYRGSYSLTAISFDADEDGWPDIFVACDSTPALLLINNHDGTFRDEAMIRGIALSGDGRQLGGMGVALGDYNLDGHSDLVKSHFFNEPTGLYKSDGKGNFDDVTVAAGLGKEMRFVGLGAGIVDFDNDGFPDILITTGSIYPQIGGLVPNFPAHSPSLLFRNRGDGSFLEMGDEAGPGIVARHLTRGTAFGDFDNDGDMDILLMNVNEPPSLLRNDAPAGNHWIKLRLEGTKSNRSAIGARVLVRYGGKVQVQEVLSQSSFLSANDPRLHFGLGAATTVDIDIHWPLGIVEKFAGVTAGQLITIREGQGIVKGRLINKKDYAEVG
jgi:enediyne biosynthesis protein E4